MAAILHLTLRTAAVLWILWGVLLRPQGLQAQSTEAAGAVHGAGARGAGTAVTGAGQACPEGRVTFIFVDNRSIFDLSQMEGDRLRWVYRLANALHVETREAFIRRQLLFREGDCPDEFALRESGRVLRQFRFLAWADVFAVEQPDGTRHVVVDTQDEWSTRFGLNFTLDDGLAFESVSVEEENLLGTGTRVAFFFRERRERRDYGVLYEQPNVLGSLVDARVAVGRTRVGTFLDQTLLLPYRSEVDRIAARQRYTLRKDLFAYNVGAARERGYVTVPIEEGYGELTGALRLGEPGNWTQLGLGLSWERIRFPGYPGGVETIQDENFDAPVPAPPQVIEALNPQVQARSATRLNFILGQRLIRFVKRQGLDPLRGVQDAPVGVDLSFLIGKSLGALNTGGTEAANDLFTSLSLFSGYAGGPWTLSSQVRIEGRQEFTNEAETGGQETDVGGWKDFLAEWEAYAYLQPARLRGHTLVGKIHFQGGWEMQTPYQITLGGLTGLRGFREGEFPGAHRILLGIEDRIALQWPRTSLLDLGVTFLAEAGQVWAGDVPFGVDSGFRSAVGAGVRLGFPSGTTGILRLDLIAPIQGSLDSRDLILRFSASEVFGLAKRFSTEQMNRSRRSGVGTTFPGVQR